MALINATKTSRWAGVTEASRPSTSSVSGPSAPESAPPVSTIAVFPVHEYDSSTPRGGAEKVVPSEPLQFVGMMRPETLVPE